MMREIEAIYYFRRARGRVSSDGEPMFTLKYKSPGTNSLHPQAWQRTMGDFSESGMLTLLEMRESIGAAAPADLSEGPDGVYKLGWGTHLGLFPAFEVEPKEI